MICPGKPRSQLHFTYFTHRRDLADTLDRRPKADPRRRLPRRPSLVGASLVRSLMLGGASLVYFLIGAVGLALETVSVYWAFLSPDASCAGGFVGCALRTRASRLLAADLLVPAAAGIAFVAIESRRLRMHYWAAYTALGCVAPGFALPLCLLLREEHMRSAHAALLSRSPVIRTATSGLPRW